MMKQAIELLEIEEAIRKLPEHQQRSIAQFFARLIAERDKLYDRQNRCRLALIFDRARERDEAWHDELWQRLNRLK